VVIDPTDKDKAKEQKIENKNHVTRMDGNITRKTCIFDWSL
jgi:hypothetical protein